MKLAFTYLGPFIIFLGVIRLMIYYSAFGVNVLGFLDFTEIVTSFFDIIIVLAIMFSIAWIRSIVSYSKEAVEKRSSHWDNIKNKTTFWKRLPIYIKRDIEYIVVSTMTLAMYGLGAIFTSYVPWEMLLFVLGGYIFGLSFGILMSEIRIKHEERQSSKEFRDATFNLVLGLIFTGIVAIMAYAQADDVKSQKKYFGSTILFDDDMRFRSDSSHYYIGNTNGYVFIHHEEQGQTDVIPMSRVKEVTFKSKK